MQFPSTRAYTYHQQKIHNQIQRHKSKNTETQIISLDTDKAVTTPNNGKQQIDFIPIEDFNWKYLESMASKVEVTDTYYDKVSKNENDEVERIQVHERRTKLTFRAENAKRCLPTTILSDILCCLDLGQHDLSEMTFKLLHDVHAQRTEPRLLSIRGTDINRKNVEIYSRPPNTDECYWIVNSNSVALQKTRNHCESLFNFTLVSAIGSLQTAFDYGQQLLWLFCPTPIPGTQNEHKAFTLFRNRENQKELQCVDLDMSDPSIVVLVVDENQNQRYKPFRDQIMAEIENTKEHILEKLKHVELDDKRLNNFFELAKDASIGIVPEITGTASSE
jgi:hypothetical protein